MTTAAMMAALRLHPVKPDEGLRFRQYLQDAGYTIEKLSDELELSERPSVRFGTLNHLLERIQEPTEINLLARLFVLGVPVPSDTARHLLSASALVLALQRGVLVR